MLLKIWYDLSGNMRVTDKAPSWADIKGTVEVSDELIKERKKIYSDWVAGRMRREIRVVK